MKRGIPAWVWVLMGLSSLTLVVAVIGISVMFGVRTGSTTVTPAAPISKNSTACKLFEDGYNPLTDAVRLKLSKDSLTAARDKLPSRIKNAEERASGNVAVALRDTREFAAGPGSSDDVGVAFFMSAETIAWKCEADGVTIDLHKME